MVGYCEIEALVSEQKLWGEEREFHNELRRWSGAMLEAFHDAAEPTVDSFNPNFSRSEKQVRIKKAGEG